MVGWRVANGLVIRPPLLNTLTVGAARMPFDDPTTPPVRFHLIKPGYGVDDAGNVWSCIRRRCGDQVSYGDWRRLKPQRDKHGYRFVRLGRRTYRNIHRLILEAFVGTRPPGHECRHLNGIRHDNRLKNLAWGTRKENAADAIRHGTQPRGSKNGKAKLNGGDVREIRRLGALGQSKASLGRQFGVSTRSIRDVLSRRTWFHF